MFLVLSLITVQITNIKSNNTWLVLLNSNYMLYGAWVREKKLIMHWLLPMVFWIFFKLNNLTIVL